MTISKPRIKDLFKDLLDEIKDFKYQITLNILLGKCKENTDREFTATYFNSPTKTVINSEYSLDKSFQVIFNRIGNWISEGSGWMIQSIDSEYVNSSIYSLLSGSSYIKLPDKLRSSIKRLINIKNNDYKCFLWCHIRHLNPLKIHPKRITKADRKMVNNLDYQGIEFPVSKKDYCKIEKKHIYINDFPYENYMVYPVHISDQKFEYCMNFLLMIDENKSHYVYIKDFNRFMCNKTKTKSQKHFCRYCLQCFSIKKILQEHSKVCLKMNGKQSVKLKSGSIKFKNNFKQLAVPFMIYADFDSLLKRVKSNNKKIILHVLKIIKIIFLAALITKLFVLMINLANQVFFTEEKLQSINLLKQFLKKMNTAKK